MGVLRLFRETRRDARFVTGVLRHRPFQVLVQVTNRCNMRCSFCAFWKNGAPPSQELTVADYERLSEELAEVGCFLVSIEGGEPTLRPDIIEIVEAFARHHVPVLFTNGWRVDPTFAQAVYGAGVAQVGVSIDYDDAARHDTKRGLTGGWARAWEAVDHLRAAAPHAGRQVHVMSVLMDDNLGALEPLFNMSRERGVGHCVTLLSLDGYRRGCDGDDALPAQGISEHLVSLWERYPHVRVFRDYFALADRFMSAPESMPTCHAGEQSFNIDHLGNVAPCIERIDHSVGNVRETPLRELLANMKGDPEVATCQACWTYCRGFATALGEGGTRRSLVDLATRMKSR